MSLVLLLSCLLCVGDGCDGGDEDGDGGRGSREEEEESGVEEREEEDPEREKWKPCKRGGEESGGEDGASASCMVKVTEKFRLCVLVFVCVAVVLPSWSRTRDKAKACLVVLLL